MGHAPPIPAEQRSFAGRADDSDPTARLDSAHPDRRDLHTDVQSPQPGDADANLRTQGRFGNINQNVAGRQQDR